MATKTKGTDKKPAKKAAAKAAAGTPALGREDKANGHPTLRLNTEKWEGFEKKDGSKGQDIGDEVAVELRKLDLEGAFALLDKRQARSEKRRDIDYRKQWSHLNPGMQRMQIGTILRAIARENSPEAQEERKAKAEKSKSRLLALKEKQKGKQQKAA